MQIHATFRHYGRVFRHHARLILLGVTLATGLTAALNFMLPSTYQARSLVKVNGNTSTTATTTTNDVFSAQAQAVSYALLVTSPEVLQQASKQLPGVAVADLAQQISASPLDNTQIIEVRGQATSAQQAADNTNAVVNAFLAVEQAKEETHLDDLSNQLNQQLTQTKVVLDNAQQQVAILQNNHGDEQTIAQQKSLADAQQASYTALLASYNQLQAQKLQALNMLRIAQVAVPPDRPASPQIALNIGLAAGLSLLVMLVLALVLDWMDTTIKTTEDVVQLAGLAPLGAIPVSTLQKNVLLDFSYESTDVARERLFLLGAQFQAQYPAVRMLMVSGLHSQVGVTTVATYLALSLAQSGQRVLLVDANLRRSLLHKIFQQPNAGGLANRLPDVHRFADYAGHHPFSWLNQWATTFPNLWLLPAGPATKQPTSLLRLSELRQLKTWLLGQHPLQIAHSLPRLVDLIIFDTPALDAHTDAQLLADMVDGTLLVLEAGKEQRETLQETQALLQRLDAPILGVVINRQKAGQHSYFYVDQVPAKTVLPLSPTGTDAGKPPASEIERSSGTKEPARASFSLAEKDSGTRELQSLQTTSDPLPVPPLPPRREQNLSTETPKPFPIPSSQPLSQGRAQDRTQDYTMDRTQGRTMEMPASLPDPITEQPAVKKMQFRPLLKARGGYSPLAENEQTL
ncbi:polysaccharide biosynthesis tyrosine autokinase [Tengunoibacter tsumagoiensis]|uniref:Polysaccharide chain length determinant N-terminal domain-containing protein n=1 Tax=Tengunoibacter tsumagoiensis TaxID=2014871 RepID=A0A401ZUM4_9CHLR|nr:polysaccharide biosynthesis tyrosine autokinase [Tengunoibacter tsumagoiensis]GCE10502.1 hypothetical protein KTT_03610 [Tengunoibacter tsumagoiensis]